MLLLLLLLTASVQAADSPPAPPAQPVLHLQNDGFVAGELRDSGKGGVLRWQSPLFATPFEFSLAGVKAVHFPPLPKPARAGGDYCFELERGDVLFGSLIGQSEKELELDIAKIGRIHVQRSSVHRFFRWRDSADVVYLGPQGLAGWKAAPAGGWREEFGHLATTQEASIRRDVGIPDRAVIEFEISWQKKPDFVLALGVDDDAKTVQQAFRFEVWGSDLVVLRELEREADVAPVLLGAAAPAANAATTSGRAHLHVVLDQKAGRCLVFSAAGSPLADLKVASDTPQAFKGIRLENKRGDVTLERLRIARWTGELPREVQADQPRVHLADGTIVYGKLTAYDAATRQFTVEGKSGASKISADLLDSAFFALLAEIDPEAARARFKDRAEAASTRIREGDETEPAATRALFHDGTQVSGEIMKVADGAVWIKSPSIKEPLRLAVADLRSVIVLRQESDSRENPAATEKEVDGRLGTLELDGVRLRGRLVDGTEKGQTSCLAWQPLGSTVASALRHGLSGRIVYHERPPAPKQAQQAQPGMPGGVRVLAGGGRVVRARPGGIAAGQRPGQKGSGQPSLYLRTGDSIPCEVTGIDENGVSIKTSLSDSMFVPHDKIKAVELVRETSNAPGLTPVKQDRLLTLPRMQRDSPPTHLIRSRDGDYLRGRLIGMNDIRLQVEVRLEVKELPRERVSRIIWLHAEDLEKSGAADPPERKPAEGTALAKLTPAEEKLQRCLDKFTRVEFLDLDLQDCITYLSEAHKIKISVTLKDKDAGVSLDKPITLKVENGNLGDVLKQMLEPLHLTYAIENGELNITASAKVENKTDVGERERKPARDTVQNDLSPAEENIQRALDTPSTVEFLNLALENCITYLREYHGIKISVDRQALEDEGVPLDQPITLMVDGDKLSSVLKMLLEPANLAHVIENDELRITTSAKAKEKIKKAAGRVAPPASPPSDKTRTRVQVLRSDETRLTFFPENFADATLSGTSDVLGACRVNLAQIDVLLIGAAIEQAAAKLLYQKWKLQNAVDPKFVNSADGSDGGDAGTESPLVGKPAPLFELDLLTGGKFKLADQKGHVVVLDFWATWCGPCLAAMPQVDRAVHDFKGRGVQLIAVNLEEGPKPIKSMLERHKLDVTVALDRDGAVAGKYQASAIPQTVIIDKEGNVVRVFIGGGTQFEEQLRTALHSLFPDSPPQSAP